MPVDVPSKKAIESLIPSELLDPSKPTGLIPIALFNRLDLAPNDVRDCGEHRIIYSFKKSADAGRLFLIFEAKLKNPHSNQGMRGCLPVAVFWRDLSDEADVEKMAKALENFYYEGLANFGPVVTAKNYGIPLGQIRGNLFDDEHKSWQLREWRVLLNGTLAAETVKNNPLAEFYSDPNFESHNPTLEEERAAFQAEFQNSYFNHLLETDTSFPNFDPANEDKRKEYERSLVNRLGARSDNEFNEFKACQKGIRMFPP